MHNRKRLVCPVACAGSLDNRIRRWLQDPQKILAPYVKEGMKVLDLGCGPGFFTLAMARMVGETGKVFAADLQDEMLQKVKNRIQGTGFESRIILHRSESGSMGISERVDFVLLFYMVHEVSDKERLFNQIFSIVQPDGQVLMVEPPFFHVSRKTFKEEIAFAQEAGFTVAGRPNIFFSKSVVFRKG